MSIKNISAIGPSGNTKPIPIYHAIPPTGDAIIKVTIDTDSGEIDVTDLIFTATFNMGVTSTIGDFIIEFIDTDKTNYNKISLFDDVYVYSDYGTEATTKRHRFKIEDMKYTENFNVVVSGRGIGMLLAEKSIIYRSLTNGALTSKNKSTILQEIIEQNFSEITDFSQIEEDTTQLEKNYSEIPFFDIVEELCGNTKYFYLDKDLVPHYFTKGSEVNTTEAISESNLVTISNNSSNAEEIYTKVRVYGQSESGIPILSTHSVGTTNTGGLNKEYIVNNSSITTQEQADEYAESVATELENYSRIGDLVVLVLPSLSPGESLFVGLPDYDLSPAHYNIKEFAINIDNNGDFPFTTSFTIESKKLSSPNIIKDMIQTQTGSMENKNPYDLDYSRVITFETDIGTHSGTEINEERLKVSGESTGTWISPIYTLDNNISAIYVKWDGELLGGDYQSTSSQLWVSTNGGTTWKSLLFTGEGTIPTGKDLKIKVVLNTSTAKVKRIGVYFKY